MDRFTSMMLDSEDSDVEEGPDVVRHKTKIIYQNTFPYIHMEPPDILYERWGKIKLEVRQAVGHMLHVSVFWWHILLRHQENHCTTAWAVDMGFLDSNVSNDLSLKRLHRIEILEIILNTVERCLADSEPEKKARELVTLSTSLKLQEDCLVKTVSWLEEFGPPGLSRKLLDLGPKQIRYKILQFVFIEYARYIQVMSCSKKKMIRMLSVDPESWSLQKSEEMKNKGNEQFQKKKYDLAVKWYTKAIKYHSNNHLLYGNRALCFIRCEKYLKAMGDGKRAIVLQKDWAKGHYRFCDALFFLGAKEKAIEANLLAQSYCSADPDGMRDLQQQYSRFICESFEGKAEVKSKKKASSKRYEGACGMDSLFQNLPKDQETASGSSPVENEHAEYWKDHQETSGKYRTGPLPEDSLNTNKDAKGEMGDRKTKKTAPCTPEKQAVRSKHPPAQEKLQPTSNGANSKKQFCAAVQDAYTALCDQRCRNAEQAFCLALRILESSTTKDLGITELDKSLLIYGYATTLVEIGQPEELAEAQNQLAKLSSSEDRKFQSLVHYGFGKVFLKENRFCKALEAFSNALLMVQRQITPGKLTWPTTKVMVEETKPEYLKKQLEISIELCKFPPKPDAICRHQHCLSHAIEIYFTDPDFKGFIRISCCQSCKVEYHVNCWKKLKAASFDDKNDKEFLHDLCFTPDCIGRICQFVIFGSTGLVKCTFETSIPKSKVPGKLRVKQKCTSLAKLKAKEEKKQRRKQLRAAASATVDDMNNLMTEDEKDHKETQNASAKDYTVYGDRVLHQICERADLFNDEMQNISTMLECLRPWIELDETKGHVSMLKGCAEPKVLRDLVDLLLEKSNRVWARIFIHNLSDCPNIKPKLHAWAQQLDNAGLKAAEKFICRYGESLEELELSSLLTFPPLQNVLIEKFGTMPELFDNTGLTVSDYLRQAPQQEIRLFIWTLEEHRERYPTCFALLDEYFETDGICLVIKKTDRDEDLSLNNKSKHKNRKKKQKEPKSVIVLSGMRSGYLRDEEDEDIFSEEDSLMLLDATDPFSVPDYLREQVAEFEGQYVGSGRLNHYKRFLDNNSDPTKESLYDYFAQILEEHGPLEASDPLLVGELENFPIEAQRKIEMAGGLEAFLVESLRFVMTENLIGLMKHAVSLQPSIADDLAGLSDCLSHTYNSDDLESKGSSHLNPAAKEFLPHSDHFSLSDSSASYDADALFDDENSPASALLEPCNSPLETSQTSSKFDYTIPQDGDMFETLEEPKKEYPYYLSTSLKDCLHKSAVLTSENNDVNSYSTEREEDKKLSVQTFGYNKGTKDDVAVNTEPHSLFEKNKGDMIQKEKNNIKFEQYIQKMKDTCESRQKKRKEEAGVIETEVAEIQQKIEITNKELSLFQQKLEFEIRKDQQEKRDNQETLKALKGEIKELEDLQESYSKQIQEKNVQYQKKLDHFLEISNQSEAEKMSLEEEIKRYRDLCVKATRRSLAAELSVLQNHREHGLRGLRKCVSDGKAILLSMSEVSRRYPSTGLLSTIEAWKSCVQEAEEKIARTEAQYEERADLMKKGTRLCSLPPVIVPSAPAPPPLPIRFGEGGSVVVYSIAEIKPSLVLQLSSLSPPPGFSPVFLPALQRLRPAMPVIVQGQTVAAQMQKGTAFLHPPSNQQPVPQQHHVRHTLPHPPYGAQQHPVRPQTHPAVNMHQPAERATHTPPAPATHMEPPHRPASPAASVAPASRAPNHTQQHIGVFERIVDRLSSMFPHYSRPVLSKFIQEVRNANGGSLSMLTYEEVINRVAQLILDHQEDSRDQMSSVSGDQVGVPSPTLPDDSCRATPTPPPAHVWKSVSSQHRSTSAALNMEDPCIICHEDMAPEDLCVLECRHSFHKECIRSWLKEQSTCPTCREHALLPEDFPMLPGRHRRGHAPAMSFS